MRYIYFHGFASGPRSRKAQAFRDAFGEHHIDLDIPDIAPDFEHVTITSQLRIIDRVVGNQPANLLGSSMGGFLAAMYASTHASIEKLVLLAPAFAFSSRWPALLGPEQWSRWQETRWLEVFHYADKAQRRVHHSLVVDAANYPPNPSFPQPARIFHGVHDPIVPIEFSRAFAANHPNAILTELDDGHELLNGLDRIVSDSISFLLA